MSLFDEPSWNAGDAKERKTDYTAYVILAILVPIIFFFRYLGNFDMGMNVAICLGMCMVAIRIRWDLRTQVWFWGVIAFVLALHVPLFFLVQWPRMGSRRCSFAHRSCRCSDHFGDCSVRRKPHRQVLSNAVTGNWPTTLSSNPPMSKCNKPLGFRICSLLALAASSRAFG